MSEQAFSDALYLACLSPNEVLFPENIPGTINMPIPRRNGTPNARVFTPEEWKLLKPYARTNKPEKEDVLLSFPYFDGPIPKEERSMIEVKYKTEEADEEGKVSSVSLIVTNKKDGEFDPETDFIGLGTRDKVFYLCKSGRCGKCWDAEG